MTPEQFEKLPLERKLDIKNNCPNEYAKIFGSTPSITLAAKYEASSVRSLQDFEKLSLDDKIHFKDNFPERFTALFASGDNRAGQALSSQSSVELNTVRTADDFEALSDTDKLNFKKNHGAQYAALWAK